MKTFLLEEKNMRMSKEREGQGGGVRNCVVPVKGVWIQICRQRPELKGQVKRCLKVTAKALFKMFDFIMRAIEAL